MPDIRVVFVLYANAEIKSRDSSIHLGRTNQVLRIRPCGNSDGAAQDVPRVSILTDTAIGLPTNHQFHDSTITVRPVRDGYHAISITGAGFRSLPRVARLKSDEDLRLGPAISAMLSSVLPNHRFV